MHLHLDLYVYAEFAAIIPYLVVFTLIRMLQWVKYTLGMIGWVLTFEYLISASTVAVGWSSYIMGLLNSAGIVLP